MIPQQLKFSATFNLDMSSKNRMEMDFSELDQGFFQICELGQGDLWIDVKVVISEDHLK